MPSKILSVVMLVFVLLSTADIQAKNLLIKDIEVQDIRDSATDNRYELYIKLPEDYDANRDAPYPVIYIADGLWHIEIFSGAAPYIVEDAILVGISWDLDLPVQLARARDYMPNKTDQVKAETGLATAHLRFLKTDVFPYIEDQFNVDSENRSFYGYSVSATFGGFILLTAPDTFKNYMLGSPETLFDGHFLHEYPGIRDNMAARIDANVFISVGEDETEEMRNHVAEFTKAITPKISKHYTLTYKRISSADHQKAFPKSALESMYWLAER